MRSILRSLATCSSFRGRSYQDLRDSTGAPAPPPPRVKFHIWLACQDRCWTRERLARRGLPHPPRCPLCDLAEETMEHLLVGCPFSRTVWHEVLSWVRSTARPPRRGDDFVGWWQGAARSTPPCFTQGDFVVDYAYGMVDLEASQCGAL
jgi:hypothetical protein